jgi:hypothetical protein
MKDTLLLEYIQDVLISVHANIRELRERKGFAEPHELEHIDTRLSTYQEVLQIFKASARDFGIEDDEIGI